MQYTNTAGQPAQGDVWSPGPMAATVWVLVAGGGHAVVHVATRREVPQDRWLGRSGSTSSKGPTLSAKLWREALGFDPRAVVRGEVEQPELVAYLEPAAELGQLGEVGAEVAELGQVAPAVEVELEPVEPVELVELGVEPQPGPVAEPEPVVTSVPVPDAEPVPEVQVPAAQLAAQLDPEVAPVAEPVALPLPVGTQLRIRVDLAGRDARVIGADLEDGRVKVRCEDTVGTVWLLDLAQVTEVGPEVVAAEPEPAARIDYRRPAGAYRKRGAAYRKLVAEPEVPAARPRIDYRKPVACADARCVDGLTRCEGCNGYGVLTAGGRRYRLASGGRNVGATAVRHDRCAGTGLAVCSCGRVATGSPLREPATG